MPQKREGRECVTIYLTTEEKEELVKKANASGESVNTYIKSKVFPNQEISSMEMKGTVEAGALLNSLTERKNRISVTLSDDEYNYIKKMAGSSTMAAFIRKTLLSANNGKYIFEIKSDDLSDVRKSLSDFNLRMEGIVGALQYRSQLFESDVITMRNLLEEVNENVKTCLARTMADRKYIRKKGIEHLQKQIDRISAVNNNREESE